LNKHIKPKAQIHIYKRKKKIGLVYNVEHFPLFSFKEGVFVVGGGDFSDCLVFLQLWGSTSGLCTL
jgi:hypothetical protein